MHELGHCLTECLLCTDMPILHEVHLTGYMPVKLNISAMAESWKVYFSTSHPPVLPVEGPPLWPDLWKTRPPLVASIQMVRAGTSSSSFGQRLLQYEHPWKHFPASNQAKHGTGQTPWFGHAP